MYADRKHNTHYRPEQEPAPIDPTPALRLLLAALIVLTAIMLA